MQGEEEGAYSWSGLLQHVECAVKEGCSGSRLVCLERSSMLRMQCFCWDEGIPIDDCKRGCLDECHVR
jgi:hypothetical protein